ncbi:MAG: spinster family MFS transporter, partial [Myxococcales bacterium]
MTTPSARSGPSQGALAGLLTLTAINFLNYADRYVVGGAQELIKHDPGFLGGERGDDGALSDASLGFLTTAFVVVYMIASPFTGALGDRIKRKYLVAGGVLVWSLATIGSGLAPNYTWLLVARGLIGVGEAGYATVAPSLMSDWFSKDWRGKVFGLFYVMMPLGAAAGFLIGGAVGQAYGWRSAFFVAGAPGLLLGLGSLLLKEPVRGAHDEPELQGERLSLLDTLVSLVRNRAYVVNTVGITLMTFAVGGLAIFMPSFLVRSVGMSQAAAGTSFGAITAGAGIAGTLAGTWLGELAQKRMQNGYFLVSGVGLLAAVPFILLTSAGLGVPLTLGAVFLALFFVLLNTAPLNTALVNCVPATTRSMAVAVNILAIHVLGDAISPPIIGKISDAT